MDKQKLLKLVPYIIMVLGVLSALFSFGILQNYENKCNAHWSGQVQKYKDYVTEQCPALDQEQIVPIVIFSMENN
ncbi:MAG: hypothetical protein IH934_04750 [Nanoarchaeota archaeon]|nr:hypothetical protein [Nanoarchaeota archaeon]